jgi:hypothetical protein
VLAQDRGPREENELTIYSLLKITSARPLSYTSLQMTSIGILCVRFKNLRAKDTLKRMKRGDVCVHVENILLDIDVIGIYFL